MAQDLGGQRVLQGATEGERVAQRSLVDGPAVLAGEQDRAADGVGEAPQVAPVVHLAVQAGEGGRAEVGGEPTAVETFQRAAVGEQGDPAAGDEIQLPDGRRGQHAALGVAGDHQPAVVLLGPGGHPPGEVGDGALGVTGRREGVRGARPEGADVPEDADGAAGGVVAVGAPAHGEQQDHAGAHQPGAEGLGGLGGGVHERRGALGGAAGGAVGEPGAGHRAGAQDEGDGGDGGHQDRRRVGEPGAGDGARDALGAQHVGALARVVEAGDVPGDALADGQHPDAGQDGDGRDHHQQRGQYRRLPGEHHRGPGDRGVVLAGGGGPVDPVGEPLGHSPGQHPGDRAGQQRDGRPAHAAQRGPGLVPGGALEEPGGHHQGQHQHALADGDPAERRDTGQRAVAPRRRPGPGGIADGEREHRQRGVRQRPHGEAVGLLVAGRLAAGGAPDDDQGAGGEQQDQAGQGPADGGQGGGAGPAVGPEGGDEQGGGDGQHPGRGVRGAQPGDEPAAVPEAVQAQRGALVGGGVAGGAGAARRRGGGLVGAPGAVREPPQEADDQQGQQGGEDQAAARGAPPAAARGVEEAQPGLAGDADRGAGALPGTEVEGDLAGRGGQQDGEGEGEQPHQEVVDPLAAVVGRGVRAHPVGEVGDHERQQDQPERAGAVAGGEVGPAVRLADRLGPVVVGPLFGVRVVGAAVAGGGVVAGDPLDPRVAEHLLRGGAADAVDQQLQGELRLRCGGRWCAPRRTGIRRAGGWWCGGRGLHWLSPDVSAVRCGVVGRPGSVVVGGAVGRLFGLSLPSGSVRTPVPVPGAPVVAPGTPVAVPRLWCARSRCARIGVAVGPACEDVVSTDRRRRTAGGRTRGGEPGGRDGPRWATTRISSRSSGGP
ncbi:hypothetical protein GZL_07344 [Streptomyces sp. 769]|nr:hypothetical protein GZL_07344 [Streptomyces sp. 769]